MFHSARLIDTWVRITVLSCLLILVGANVAHAMTTVNNVVIISVDGLGENLYESMGRDDLMQLTAGFTADKGAHKANKALTVMPPLTIPAHISMLSGVLPSKHNMLDDGDDSAATKKVSVPTIFDLVSKYQRTSALVVGKQKLFDVFNTGVINWMVVPDMLFLGHYAALFPRFIDDAGADEIAVHHPTVLFMHYALPDTIGHIFKWGSQPQKIAVGMVIDSIVRFFHRANFTMQNQNWAVIMTADHGGHLGGHGQTDPSGALEDPDDLEVPFIMWGAEINDSTVHVEDVAPTAAYLLGLQVPPEYNWTGHNVAR